MYYHQIWENIFSCLNVLEKEYYLNITTGLSVIKTKHQSQLYELSPAIYHHYSEKIDLPDFFFQVTHALKADNNNLIVYLFLQNQDTLRHELCSCFCQGYNPYCVPDPKGKKDNVIHVSYFLQAIENNSLSQFSFFFHQIKKKDSKFNTFLRMLPTFPGIQGELQLLLTSLSATH